MQITTQAIRPYNVGFAIERERYLRHAKEGILPSQLEHLAYSLPWPVDMEAPLMHLGNFSTPIEQIWQVVSANNYDPDNIPNDIEPDNIDPLHMGIDIQSMPGAKVKAVESGIVTAFGRDTREQLKHLANIYVLSKSTNITWSYSHLDFDSIPDKIKKHGDFFFDKNGPIIEIEQDEFIGEIGPWKLDLIQSLILEDVQNIYGKEFHHLDLSAMELDENGISATQQIYFNPLLFLKKLYDF